MKYNPHEYQKYAIKFIKEHPIAAILLDMGMGKTSIVLSALNELMYDSFEITKVLIIAPLRVARNTWSDEIKKWDHLNGIRYSIAVGTAAERLAALKADADIYIINRENVPWLIEESGLPFDFDCVVVDELSSFKNWQAKRFKALMKVRPKIRRIVGLTGTPSSNGLMDLFAEFKVLDMGERLGRFISQYSSIFSMSSRGSIIGLVQATTTFLTASIADKGSFIQFGAMITARSEVIAMGITVVAEFTHSFAYRSIDSTDVLFLAVFQ